jgi:soluble lytic murein transglycosylase-like protein
MVLLMLAGGVARGQTAPISTHGNHGNYGDDTRGRMEASVQRQKVATEAMKTSIEAHRQSAAAKRTTSPQGEFFLFPPPAGSSTSAPKPQCEALPAAQVDELVTQAGEESSVSPDLLRAVMREESAFRPCAVSGKGAMGLMQLMQGTASDLGVGNAFDPRENVTAGAKFLKQLINLYNGDLTLALSAYNAGPGKVDQSFGIPPIPETINYVNRVLSAIPFPEPAESKKTRLD